MVDPRVDDVKVFVPCRDFEQSLSFYVALGWRINWRDIDLAELEAGGARFLLQDFYVEELARHFRMYIPVKDVRIWRERVRDVLATGRYPDATYSEPEAQISGALIMCVWDPSGVLLQFAQKPDQHRI
jgi:catechol 2,3-dioxygenase-like lactoylglutathione lyase family enzyme